MTQNKSSKNENQSKSQRDQSNGKVTIPKAINDLQREILDECKKLTLQKTSSAFGIISKTRELLRLEDMQD